MGAEPSVVGRRSARPVRNCHARTGAVAWLIALLSFVGTALYASAGSPEILVTPPAASRPSPATSAALAVEIKSFSFRGNTRISDADLNAAVSDILAKRWLTQDDLDAARDALTNVYIVRGFINSGALLEDQDLQAQDGVLTWTIVEGKLTAIDLRFQKFVADDKPPEISETGRLRRGYVLSRAWPDGDAPLNVIDLKNNLELLRLNPNVRTINAELKPGAAPGESTLDLAVSETFPIQVGLQFDNNRSPSVGAERFSLLFSDTNLTGNSDTIGFRLGLNKGSLNDLTWAGTDDLQVDYTLPITRRDTTLQVSFSNTDSPVVEEPFRELKISSRTESFQVMLRHPLVRTPTNELAFSLGLARRYNKTFLAGEPFSFSPGAIDGVSNVTVIRFGQEYITRSAEDALALRSTFNFGVPSFGATRNGAETPDGQFLTWQGQGQYARRLNENDWQAIVRGAVQLSNDSLLPLEQFSLGGLDTVRGYRENEIVRDSGWSASAELRIPVWRTSSRSILSVAPFIDAGYAWNDHGMPHSELLSSAGVGLLFNPNDHVTGFIYWGIPFHRFDDDADNDLQDEGIHFSLTVFAF